MENPFDQFEHEIHDVRLSEAAKTCIRDRLILHMREYPHLSPYQRFFGTLSPFFTASHKRATVLATALVVVLSGTAVGVAGDALPGDTLYSLKVSVMEPVKGLFSLSPEARATWNASLTDIRLSEVEQLAVQEKFTPQEGIKSKERFDNSLDATEGTIQKLSEKDPDAAARISAAFNAELDKHERLLSVLADAEATGSADEVQVFALHVRSKIKRSLAETALMSASTSLEATTTPAHATSTEENGGSEEGRSGEGSLLESGR